MSLAMPSIDIQSLLEGAFTCHQAGDLNGALDGYGQILSCDPDHVDALQLSGLLARQQKRFEDAISLLDHAISINPDVAVFHHNLAETYHALEDLSTAEACYREAVRLAPAYVDPQINLGAILQGQAKLVEALECFKAVVVLQTDHVLGQYNLASCYRTLGNFELASSHCHQCLQLDPAHIDANLMLAGFLLSEGDFEEGWRGYEWRRYLTPEKANSHHSMAPFPRWDGSSLQNKRILLQAEQGLGDEIMFASCVSDVVDAAGDCLLECDPRLAPLFSRSFPDVSVVSKSTENNAEKFLQNGPIDFRMTIGSLPSIFRKSITDFRSGDGYLVADQNLRLIWRERLSALPGRLKVGVSWRGGKGPAEQMVRSVPLSLWAPMFEIAEVDFINLQYGDHDKEVSSFNGRAASPLVLFPEYDPLEDLDGAAALMAELDLVITIDNSSAHLAGALGTPVWTLLPCGSNWRWLKGREDSYWYGSMRLFQQKSFGGAAWEEVVRGVTQSLQCRIAAPEIVSEIHPGDCVLPLPDPKVRENIRNTSLHRQRKALLINDTASWYHWGCSCTSIAIHQQLNEMGFSVTSLPINAVMAMSSMPLSVEDFDSDLFWASFKSQQKDVVQAIEQSDVVVVNGEGSLHGLGPLPLKLLFLMYLSGKRLKTPVHLINHSCYPTEEVRAEQSLERFLYQKVYSELDFCGVREIKSARVLKELGVPARITFDCMPLFVARNFTEMRNEKGTSIVIAGSVALKEEGLSLLSSSVQKLSDRGYDVKLLIGADASPAVDDLRFASALGRLCPESFSLINADSELEWLNTINQAQLLISGRFHHSIAAALLKTPFIALETNTPKLDALLEMLSLPWRIPVGAAAAVELMEQMIEELLTIPEKGIVSEDIRAELLRLSLTNFEGLQKIRM